MKASRASMATADMARTAYGRGTVPRAGIGNRSEGAVAATTQIGIGEPLFLRGEPTFAPPDCARIFDIPIDLGRPPELMRRITSWVGSGEAPRRVMYVNAHVLNQSREIPSLR